MKEQARVYQQELALEKVKSFSFDQHEILRNIIRLYIPEGRIQVDATYGYGIFYKTVLAPEHKFDIEPKKNGVTKCDCRNLPLEKNSIHSLIFDPPFVLTDHKNSEHYLMHKRYSGFKLISELREMYNSSIQEFARVLKPGGVLVIKCQDMTHGKKNYFIHNEILNMAAAANFMELDLFILLSNNRFSGRVLKQRTARKHHCYFIVLRKRSRQRNANKIIS